MCHCPWGSSHRGWTRNTWKGRGLAEDPSGAGLVEYTFFVSESEGPEQLSRPTIMADSYGARSPAAPLHLGMAKAEAKNLTSEPILC